MSIADRNWTFARCLAYFYNAFSGLCDGEIDTKERDEQLVCLSKWLKDGNYLDENGIGYDLSDKEIFSLMDETMNWFHEDMNEEGEYAIKDACDVFAEMHRKWFSILEKAVFIDDLIRIALADDNFHDKEKAWITEMASMMGLSFSNLENWDSEKKKFWNGEFKDYYSNGQIKEEGDYNDGKKVGVWTYWYRNGQMEWKEIYDNGKLKRSTGWYDNGTKAEEGDFMDKMLFGEWTWWYRNGNKDAQGTYKINKLKDGLWREWYLNGRKKQEGEYKSNMLHGLWTLYYDNEDNTKKIEGKSKKGRKDGMWTNWYPNGQISEQGSFENGIKVGSWTYYNEDGSIDYFEDYLEDGSTLSGAGH